MVRLRPLAVTMAMMLIHIASKETTIPGTIDRLIQFAMAYALVAWAMKPNGGLTDTPAEERRGDVTATTEGQSRLSQGIMGGPGTTSPLLSEHGANSRRTRRCSVQPIVLRRALARDGDNEVGLEGNPPFPGERSEPGNKALTQ
jgi:hypothetical protein